MSEPSQPGASPQSPDAKATEGPGFPRLLRVAAFIACLVSACFAAHGIIMTAQHLFNEIPAGIVTGVEPTKGGSKLTLDTGRAASLPLDIQLRSGERIEPRPGMRVQKKAGSLTYSIDGQRRGGAAWALRQWLLPARVTLPLVVYFILSWLLILRAEQHKHHMAVELIVIPLLRWLAIVGAAFIALALIAGCVMGCGQLLFRMAG
ncbi:MAG: hypothetical protein QOF78_229 [Phycisphaerales bacterium]|nr:hypothetical protein [Phycisphaerales bacterium]